MTGITSRNEGVTEQVMVRKGEVKETVIKEGKEGREDEEEEHTRNRPATEGLSVRPRARIYI